MRDVIANLLAQPPVPVADFASVPLSFGSSVLVGETKTVSFEVRNTGGGDLQLTGLQSGLSELSMTPENLTISPGSSGTVTLTLMPEQVGNLSGTLEILTNIDPIRLSIQEVTVQLPPPVVAVAQQALDFGTSGLVGQAVTVSVEIQNTGGSDLMLTGFQSGLAGVSMTPEDLTISSGSSGTVSVTLTPMQAGTLSGTLEILTNVDPIQLSIQELIVQTPLPTIAVGQKEVAFGQVEVGRSVQRTITVRNEGLGDLQVTEIRSAVAGLSVSQQAFTVAPGSS